MSRFLVFCLSVVFCFYVYSNIGVLYPIQIQYGKSAPHMNVRSFFSHQVKGWGVVKKWNGIVRNKIYIDIEGSWIDNIGILNQNIEFDDGEKINLTWRIKMLDKNTYTIVASHCVDNAMGQQHGNMNIFTCKVVKEKDGSVGDYTFETVMYMVDRHNILATTKIKRYGFLIGSAMFNLQKADIE